MSKIAILWNSRSERDWKNALEHYWDYVRPENIKLERNLNELKLEEIAGLDQIEWFNFLHEKYFRWKYTAPNRYVTTTMSLKRYIDSNKLENLFQIKQRLLNLNLSDIRDSLKTAHEIYGLGIAGASGLLSLMYPHYFATVDQFAIKALREIPELSENQEIEMMNPDNITLKNGIILISLIRRKAKDNNSIFNSEFWTPRKIDMILWATRE
jgi:hypothetical protein